MAWLVFERSLILEVDENKDGVFDFEEVVKFMVDANRVNDKSEKVKIKLCVFSVCLETNAIKMKRKNL